jgi:hypothetical protein
VERKKLSFSTILFFLFLLKQVPRPGFWRLFWADNRFFFFSGVCQCTSTVLHFIWRARGVERKILNFSTILFFLFLLKQVPRPCFWRLFCPKKNCFFFLVCVGALALHFIERAQSNTRTVAMLSLTSKQPFVSFRLLSILESAIKLGCMPFFSLASKKTFVTFRLLSILESAIKFGW